MSTCKYVRYIYKYVYECMFINTKLKCIHILHKQTFILDAIINHY